MKYLKLKFLLMFFALAMAIPPAWAETVEFDFTNNDWGIPEGSNNKTQGENSYTNETTGYTITLTSASGSGYGNHGYYYNNQSNYLMMCYSSARLILPAFDKVVSKIEVICTSGTSSSATQNIFLSNTNTPVSTETNSQGTHEYVINESYQEIGTIYSLKQTASKNAQLQKVIVYFQDNDPTINVGLNPPTLNIGEAGGSFTVTGTNLIDNVGVTPSAGFIPTLTSDVENQAQTNNNGNWWFDRLGGSTIDGTVAVAYNGNHLKATGTITMGTKPYQNAPDEEDITKIVTVNYLYDGDIYILGNYDGAGWNFNDASHKMENTNGTYTATFEIPANSYVVFARKLSEYGLWDDGHSYFGGPSNDYPVNQNEVTGDLDVDNHYVFKIENAGEYTFTVNANNETFSIVKALEPTAPVTYEKVKSTDDVTDGNYLIVYEMGATGLAFDGSRAKLDDTSNNQEVTITDEKITTSDAIYFTYDASAKTLKSASGYYIGNNSNSNGLSRSESAVLTNTITIDNDGNAVISALQSGGTYNNYTTLRFNSASNQSRFRYYTSGQQAIQLYKEVNTNKVATPKFTPAAGTYTEVQEVTISCTTEDATIYYSTDGTNWTQGTTVNVTESCTLYAKATKTGMDDSSTATAEYIINLPTEVETVNEAVALDKGTNFVFKNKAVVVYHKDNQMWIQDYEPTAGGALVYDANGFNFEQSDVLKTGWTGTTNVHNGKKQIINLAAEKDGEKDPVAMPRTTLSESNINEYVLVENVAISSDMKINLGNRGEVTLYTNKFGLYSDFTPAEGFTYNVKGIVDVYNSTLEIYPLSIELVKQDLTLGFDPASVELYVGETFTAPALTGVPEGETIDVTYSSNNTALATVTDNVVSLVEGATGTATITANFAGNDLYNSATATYTITVNEKLAHGMSFSAETLNVTYGDEDYEAPTLNNPNSLTVTYESDNEDVAVVDENTGELLLGDAGTAVITAKTKGDASHNGGSVSYTVNIAKAAAGLAYETAQYTVYAGQDFEAPTLTNPNKLTVTYESSNEDVALVDETGDVLIGEKVGDAKITAKFEGNKNYEAGSASYTIHVIAKDNVTMSFDPTSVTLYVDEEFAQPTLTTNPANLPVKYSSDNEEVAMVDETSGEVLLMEKAGTATITAKYAGNDQYNEASATYTITVENRPEILIDDESLDLGTTGEGEIFVMASDLKENVTVTSSNENFKVEPPTITPEQAANGVNVTVTYTGNNPEGESTTITFSTKDGEDVKVTVTAKAETYVDIAAPTFAPAAGTYTEAKEVAIACATPGVTITYAIDGVDKGEYNGPFIISDGEHTVTATAMMGTRTVYTPAESSATYTINAADAANIADDYYFLQSNAAEVSGKYANVAGRRTLNFVADADKQAGTVFRVMTDPDTIGQVETLRSQAVDLQGYANRAMAYVPKVIDLVLSTLANSSLGDPETPGTGILGENGLDLILNKFYEGFDYNLYVEQGTEGTYRIYGRTPSMQHVVDFYHENTAQVEEKLPMLEGYINQVLDKIRSKIPAPYDANVVVPFSLKTVRDRIADKYGIALIDPTQDLMGFYRQVLNNKEYVWDFAYQTAMMYVDVIKQTGTYQNLDPEYKLFVEKMEKVRPDTKYYIIERGNELDYISENNTEIINNDPRTFWTLTKRVNFTVNVPEANKLNDSYYTTLYTDFGYELPADVKAYAVTGIDENDVAQLTEITDGIPAQTPVLLKADAAGPKVLTLKTDSRGGAIEGNLLEGPDYLITKYQIKTPAVVSLFNMAQGFVPADVLADYEYLQLRYSGTVNNKYFWNVNSDLEDLQGDCVVRSLAVKDGTLAFSEHWTTETNKAFLVSDTKPVIYLEKETLAAPTFSPVPGSYTVDNGQNVTITITAEDDATIKYSTDGGKTWNTYEGPIAASDDMTIVAKAEKDGMIASDEVTAVYVIDNPAELPDVPVMKGYFQIKNKGNEKYAHVQGRKTLTFTDAPADKAGTVIWLETNNKGQVQSLRSQAADLQRYADRVVEYYVPKAVELVVEKLHADGAGNILGENGLDAIMEKFNESFDHHLYVEQAGDDWRLYGKTPSMQPVVEFYREHTAQVEAKLPMLESFINSALDKLKQTIGGGGTIFQPFSLLNIWERMGGTLTKPEDDASIMAFYREVLNNKNYVWDFAYQTATFYLENLKSHQRWPEVEAMMGEYAQYFNKLEQVRPDFKYYIVADGEKPDFISEGNVDIINDAARTIWTVEPRTTFTVNITGEQFGCPLATNGVGGYFTTNYTDFAYTLPEGVTAYKVTGVNDEGEATLEALSGTIPAQTPVLLVAKEEGDYALILSTEADTPVENNLLVGPDYLINKYDFKTEQVQSIFDLIKDKLGESFYNNYVAQYEYLADLNSGTVNNKYFWSVDNYLDDLQGDCVVRSLATDENGKLAFSEHWKTETNKAFLVSDTFDVITLPSFERGDVNHDGEINIKDVSDLIDRLLGNEANSCPYCSDVNCDDDVNIKDVSDLIDFLLNSGADTHVDTPTTDPEEGDGN